MLPEGKLDISQLKELLVSRGASNRGIVQGPAIGVDVAVIDFDAAKERACEYYGVDPASRCFLILKSDPITFPTSHPGRYVIIINGNDLVTAGAVPYGFLVTLVAPVGNEESRLLAIQRELHEAAKDRNISILGGHTEISSTVNSIIVSGFMVGFVPEVFLPKHESVEVGDVIVQVGWAGIEGTSILASEGRDKLKSHLTPSELQTATNTIELIDISERALAINSKYRPKMIHDCTEGGILGGLYEMIYALRMGADITGPFPVMNETGKICELLEIDPLRLISSGTFFVVATRKSAEQIVADDYQVPCRIIGKMRPSDEGVTCDGKPLAGSEPDELIPGLANLEKL